MKSKKISVGGLFWRLFKSWVLQKPERLGFLKCDARGCNHQEYYESVEADLINRSCPRCGANLLTAGDFYETSTREDKCHG